LLVLLPVACQQEMAAQPSYKPFDPSEFFADGSSARPLVSGTVARGQLRSDLHFFTGKRSEPGREWAQAAAAVANLFPLAVAGAVAVEQDDYVATFPFPITRLDLERGRTNFMIYCVVCHDALGTGRGKIVERGYTHPPSYHIERLRSAPVGRFFDVITHGYGSMPDYREQIPPRERWQIAAYIRALQWTQHFPVKDLPGDLRKEWEQQATVQAGGGKAP
jgi:hypothetical protein